jgi:outer membrane protein assembly factor BamE (lipoprotein component of BamABCDE complex)
MVVRVACALCALALSASGCRSDSLDAQREWIELHPNAPQRIRRAVIGKKLLQGMTKDAVIASWGEPTTTLRLGTNDSRWTYLRPQTTSGRRYNVEYTLVFSRETLVAIHQQPVR